MYGLSIWGVRLIVTEQSDHNSRTAVYFEQYMLFTLAAYFTLLRSNNIHQTRTPPRHPPTSRTLRIDITPLLSARNL